MRITRLRRAQRYFVYLKQKCQPGVCALTLAGGRQRDIVKPVVEWADTFLLPLGCSLRGREGNDIGQM